MITLYVQVGDANYSCTVHGQGPPIVLLHGFTGRASTWDLFVNRWQKDFQVITIDLPGHGKTTTKTPRTMESCCDDLMYIFQYLQLPFVHLVGYSMGGRTALSFAMTYPRLVKSLILESASPGLRDPQERASRRKHDERLIKRINDDGLPAFVDFWENIPLFETQKALSKEIQQKVRQERLSQTAAGLMSSLRYMGTGEQPSWWEQLKQLNRSVLLIVGECDHKFVTINKQMQKRFQRAELAIVKDAGHAVHIEQPSIFSERLTHFIHNQTSSR